MVSNEHLSLIGKKNRELEKAFGFTHYIELKDFPILGREQDHNAIRQALLDFISDDNLIVVKTDNGIIKDFSEMSKEEAKKNLLLLKEDKGLFFDEDLEISYALMGSNFFSYVFSGMIMFSANKESAEKMASILDKHNLEYFEPHNVLERERALSSEKRKIGRNEPCPCGSGIKYKKCCLDSDIKELGKPRKI
ncbi:MAG: SEC-C metal-binding domain-containing protein [Nanoarchaeota archaeon]|nr:SEC-C metal-binding domain-containing protein [Nanoarchaeota archaeon]